MPLLQDHIDANTPMGANLVADGATFRVWAPRARAVYVNGVFNGTSRFTKDADSTLLLQKNGDDRWTGFVSGVKEGDRYKFYVVGPTGYSGYKRDPYARELTTPEEFPGSFAFPACDCVVRNPNRYRWHDDGFRPAAFNDLVIYQLHVGTFHRPAGRTGQAKFLDVVDKIEHLMRLGANAIEPLPIDEAGASPTKGYDGRDYFSPEMDFGVAVNDLEPYKIRINDLLGARGKVPVTKEDMIGSMAQLKLMIDLCHVYGIAVIFDVVYNHAGGFQGDDDCIYFFDLVTKPGASDNNNSLYFTDQGVAGGLVFAYWNRDVRQFLIDNTKFWMTEFHVDGFRYDLVNEIDAHGGEGLCQDLTPTVRFHRPRNVQIAEYWRDPRGRAVLAPLAGLGFDAAWQDRLRDELWNAISAAAAGATAFINLDSLSGALAFRPADFPNFWRPVQYIESQDEVAKGQRPRIALRADPSNSRSWYARSRSRVAMGVLLTAPGIPMLFMGQEFLEDKQWSDNPDEPFTQIYFDGLNPTGGDKHMQDFYRFAQDIVRLRLRHPALRGENINVFLRHNANRVLAYHRWLEGTGRDVVVVVSFKETTFNQPNYRLGFPQPGRWEEVFNSDAYDDIGKRNPFGNRGSIIADGPSMDGFQYSAGIVIPANSILVFARDKGD